MLDIIPLNKNMTIERARKRLEQNTCTVLAIEASLSGGCHVPKAFYNLAYKDEGMFFVLR